MWNYTLMFFKIKEFKKKKKTKVRLSNECRLDNMVQSRFSFNYDYHNIFWMYFKQTENNSSLKTASNKYPRIVWKLFIK